MVRTSASVSRTRDDTVSSPSPGSSISMVPMREKHSMNAAAKAGRNETSIFIAMLVALPFMADVMHGQITRLAARIAGGG